MKRHPKPYVLAAIAALIGAASLVYAAFRFDQLETKTLDFLGEADPGVSSSGRGRMYYDSTLNQLMCSENGGAFVACVGSIATATPTPTGTPPTPTPTFTASPTPTATPVLTATPTPTAVPYPQLFVTTAGTSLSTSTIMALEGVGNNPSGGQASVLGADGTFRLGTCTVTSAPGAGKSWTFSLDANGVPTGISVVISGASPGTCAGSGGKPCVQDSSNTYPGTVGARMRWNVTAAGGPASADMGCSVTFDRTSP